MGENPVTDELNFDAALRLARSLTTILEFPRFEDAIMATAFDLVDWCQGAILDGRVWAAEGQARWLVTEARRGWNKWLGTADFYALYKGKFEPSKRLERQVIDLGQKPPIQCSKCNDFGTRFNGDLYQYCECESGKQAGVDMGESWLQLLNKTKLQTRSGQILGEEAGGAR
jgi:hypothetical protein